MQAHTQYFRSKVRGSLPGQSSQYVMDLGEVCHWRVRLEKPFSFHEGDDNQNILLSISSVLKNLFNVLSHFYIYIYIYRHIYKYTLFLCFYRQRNVCKREIMHLILNHWAARRTSFVTFLFKCKKKSFCSFFF